MRRYSLSAEAEQDLDEIKKYILKLGGPGAARYVFGELRRAMQFLADNPGAGHRRDDLTDNAVKFWPVFSYLIVYDPEKHPVEIVRVLHGRRNVARILDED